MEWVQGGLGGVRGRSRFGQGGVRGVSVREIEGDPQLSANRIATQTQRSPTLTPSTLATPSTHLRVTEGTLDPIDDPKLNAIVPAAGSSPQSVEGLPELGLVSSDVDVADDVHGRGEDVVAARP